MRARVAAAAVVIVALVASARAAHAQAPGQTPIGDGEVPPPYARAREPGLAPPLDGAKDPDTAILWSLGGTVGGFGLLYYGAATDNDTAGIIGAAAFITGPSWGHWYAGRIVTPGLGMRAGGIALGYVGIGLALQGTFEDDGSRSDDKGALIGGLLLGGAALYVIGGVYDITTAGTSAREWNERHTLSLMPTAMSTGHGTATGLALTGTF